MFINNDDKKKSNDIDLLYDLIQTRLKKLK